jgi:hypothetical protein
LKTPSYFETGPSVIGMRDPDTIGWDTEVKGDGVPKHGPSKMLERGLLPFVAGYGHEDITLRPGKDQARNRVAHRRQTSDR